MKRMIGGGIAAAAVAGGLALAAPAHADGLVMPCGPGYGVKGGSTTCSFAYNVAVTAHGQNRVYAYSPATDTVYQMECGPTTVNLNGYSRPGARCARGNNAVVVLR
jgi:hypothetical protein